jgi:hypothetical protein
MNQKDLADIFESTIVMNERGERELTFEFF